ncbi:MAG: hisG [Firmicutes bacterium]|nr:hisG [Bacillota bacterium]
MTSSDMDFLTIALPKGKLFSPAAEMLAEVGYTAEGLSENSRKLVIANDTLKIRFIITKTADLPTYVEYGAADIGIIGKDVLLEEDKDVFELLDLKFGLCRMVLAVPERLAGENVQDYAHMRVATKYPKIAERFFHDEGIQTEIVKLNGSIELAPIVGLAEMIVDLVETGRTLKENKLVEVARIHQATARLIANRVSFKMKFDRINKLKEDMRTLVEKRGLK